MCIDATNATHLEHVDLFWLLLLHVVLVLVHVDVVGDGMFLMWNILWYPSHLHDV